MKTYPHLETLVCICNNWKFVDAFNLFDWNWISSKTCHKSLLHYNKFVLKITWAMILQTTPLPTRLWRKKLIPTLKITKMTSRYQNFDSNRELSTSRDWLGNESHYSWWMMSWCLVTIKYNTFLSLDFQCFMVLYIQKCYLDLNLKIPNQSVHFSIAPVV